MLARNLRRFGYSPAFYPVTTLKSLFSLMDKVHPEENARVCKVNCGECPAFYIGQTGRSLNIRIQEHKSVFHSKNPSKSAVGFHWIAFNHNPEKISVKLIHPHSKSNLLNQLEEIETIKHHKSDRYHSLNNMEATFFNPLIRYIVNSSAEDT